MVHFVVRALFDLQVRVPLGVERSAGCPGLCLTCPAALRPGTEGHWHARVALPFPGFVRPWAGAWHGGHRHLSHVGDKAGLFHLSLSPAECGVH